MPAKRKPRARAARCSYREGNRRCVRNGAGDPSLCAAHRIVLEEEVSKPSASHLADAVSRIAKGQKVSTEGILGAIGELFGMFGGGRPAPVNPPPGGFPWGFTNPPQPSQPEPPPRTRNVWEEMQEAARRARAQQPPPPPNPGAQKIAALLHARKILGFKPTQPLTLDAIKARRRELAMKHHPDRGGSLAKMQQINDAADVLESAAG